MTKLQYTKASDIKLALLLKYRFMNGCHLVSTECGAYSSDVLVVDNNRLIEFEVKISLSDFKADFKKEKHKIYETASKSQFNEDTHHFVPHLFYFVVPRVILPDVVAKLIGKPYGVIAIEDIKFVPSTRWLSGSGYMKTVKRALPLRTEPVTKPELWAIVSRLSSEMINAKIDLSKKQRNGHGKESESNTSAVQGITD